MPRQHALVWAGEGEWRAEQAVVGTEARRFRADGVQVGVDPLPYRVEYRLETDDGWVTRLVEVSARGAGWWRALRLERSAVGTWTATTTTTGAVDLPEPGGDTGDLGSALDCDLGRSPLTNSMPVLREGLLAGGGPRLFRMAWISVPDLAVTVSDQVYEHVSADAGGSVVRFRLAGEEAHVDLPFDADGFVGDYPGLATRIRS